MADPIAANLAILPVDVQGGPGIKVTRAGLRRTATLNYDSVPLSSSVSSAAFVAVQTEDGSIVKVLASVLSGGGGGGDAGIGGGTAGTAIPALRVVRVDTGGIFTASAAAASHFGKVVGVSLAASSSGGAAVYRISGSLVSNSFSFAPGPVYLGADGTLTQTYPSLSGGAVFSQQIGYSSAPSELFIDIDEPVILA